VTRPVRPLRSPLLGLLALAAAAPRAEAHDGPPYPVITDRTTRYGRLSAWGDPDVGTGTFWIDLERAGARELEDVEVSVAVQPVDGRLPAQERAARLVQKAPGARRYLCEVQFDAAGTWWLRARASGALGREEVEVKVEVTPPGQGPVLDFVIYSFPFVTAGVLFILAMVRRRRSARSGAPRGTGAGPSSPPAAACRRPPAPRAPPASGWRRPPGGSRTAWRRGSG